jgi:uncharacterized protein
MRPRNWSSRVAVEHLVINTGPLILLEKAGALDIAGRLPFQMICPPAVRRELDIGVTQGYAEIRPSWLQVMPLKKPLSPLIQAALDWGEAEVIELALENRYPQVCLDDLRGRRLAIAAGLRVVGVLGLLATAKKAGIIGAARPFTERLLRAGAWYSPALVARVLTELGES